MCGFSFYCSSTINPVSELETSLLKMQHRGPDASNTVYKKINNFFIGVGHNRLSILDLSDAGRQPMDLGHDMLLAYNGEVYNHQSLRILLQNKGYILKGHSDTEVVSLLYTALGVDSFALLKGMFAFVIVDEKRRKIIVVRDRLGIKPLYIFQDDNNFFASSEIRGLKAFAAVKSEISRDDVFEFFNQGFLYEPATGYLEIKKLTPGHYLEFDLITGAKKEINYSIADKAIDSSQLAQKVSTAINQQLVSDVPLGTFFSGGIDSTIIANYAKDNDLFFAKYNADKLTDYDQIFSNKISTYFKKPLIVSEISSEAKTADELMQTVNFVAQNTEELLSDYTFWSTYRLSLAARKKGYKVMLSGMGGDELFAGYPRYLVLKRHRLIKSLRPFLNLFLKLGVFPKKLDKQFERLVSYSEENHWPTAYSRLLGYFSRNDLNKLFVDMPHLDHRYKLKLNRIMRSFSGNTNDKVKLGQYFDLVGFLAHNLSVSDKASMLASIELRVPLLDESIVAHGLSLTTNELLKKGQLKYQLKTLLATLLPNELTKRPKVGFNPPLDDLILTIGKQRIKNEMIYAKNHIDITGVDSLLEQHFSGGANHTYKLWQLLYFSRWLQNNDLH